AVADPAADHLEQQIRIGEGREHQPKLGIAEVKCPLNLAGRRADVHPVDIGDEVHYAEHRQHNVGGLEPKPHLLPPELALMATMTAPIRQHKSRRSAAPRALRLDDLQMTTLRCPGAFDFVGSSSDFIAASTPPARCGTPAAARPISTDR